MPRNTTSTRRKMLKNMGAGATAVGIGSGVVIASDRGDSITITRDKNGPVREKSVPRKWNEHRKRARAATERFSQTHSDTPGIKLIGKGRGPDTFGGKRGFQINVRVEPNEFKGSLPEQVDGIPVNVNTDLPVDEGLAACSGSAGTYDTVSGGRCGW